MHRIQSELTVHSSLSSSSSWGSSVLGVLGVERFVDAQELGEGDVLGARQHRHRVLDGVVDDVLDLQLVLVVGVRVRERPELLRQLEAVRHVLGRNKVLGHLDATVQVAHLQKNNTNPSARKLVDVVSMVFPGFTGFYWVLLAVT